LPAILIQHLDEVSLNVGSNQSPFGVGPECIDVLADLGAKEAIEPLQKLLATSKDEDLNNSIRLALTRLTVANKKDLAKRLMQIAETANTSSERRSALDHVGPTGQRWTVPRLLTIAKTSTNSSVIHGAITEIGELGGDEAVAGLITLFDHDFSHVPRSEMRRKGEEWSDFDPIVAIALKTATGEALGNDAQAWRGYLK
jgi:HEAT repeat protein